MRVYSPIEYVPEIFLLEVARIVYMHVSWTIIDYKLLIQKSPL